MAKAPMEATTEIVSGSVEILYKSDYEAEAVTLDTAARSEEHTSELQSQR